MDELRSCSRPRKHSHIGTPHGGRPPPLAYNRTGLAKLADLRVAIEIARIYVRERARLDIYAAITASYRVMRMRDGNRHDTTRQDLDLVHRRLL